MSGRRNHPRFSVLNTWSGGIRVLRDVVIDRVDRDQLLAISVMPAPIGEDMSLDLLTGSGSVEVRVKVVESRPVVVDGSIRHRLRLTVAPLEPEPVGVTASPASLDE